MMNLLQQIKDIIILIEIARMQVKDTPIKNLIIKLKTKSNLLDKGKVCIIIKMGSCIQDNGIEDKCMDMESCIGANIN